MIHKILELPYTQESLAPRMSAETIAFHYGKHYSTYLDNVNKLIINTPYETMSLQEIVVKADGTLYNNAAQAWNHQLFFEQLRPQPRAMSPHFKQAVEKRFGSLEEFKKTFCDAAIGLFGSGWAWLAVDEKHEMQILALPNAGNPATRHMQPICCIDVWEHAYYIDYRNRRAEYVENVWALIDWQVVEKRIQFNIPFLFY